jgi:NADH dehydrogenase (ubiquinone) Fe-S protein 6
MTDPAIPTLAGSLTPVLFALFMIAPPETIRVTARRVSCDGSGHGIPAALGHPRVFLEIDEHGFVDCGYCDRRFVLIGGVADHASTAEGSDIGSSASH